MVSYLTITDIFAAASVGSKRIMNLKRESVWDYPRPAIFELHIGTIEVIINNKTLAKTNNAIRVIETSHPPTYYFPPLDVKVEFLKKNKGNSFCEWKGLANYLDLSMNEFNIQDIGWYYSNPKRNFLPIRNFISFYASKAEKCFVNGEQVKKQDGDFYGGWVTKNLKGPFKGGAGTYGW